MRSDVRRGVPLLIGAALLVAACGSTEATDTAQTEATSRATPRANTTTATTQPSPPTTDENGCSVGLPLSNTTTLTAGDPSMAADVDPAGVGLIIGHSNAAMLGRDLQRASPVFEWVNAGQSGNDSEAWATGADGTWERAERLLDEQGRTPDEVEVVLVHLSRIVEANDEQNWEPLERYVEDLDVILAEIQQRYPSASLVYLGSRISGHFSAYGNREPSAYRHGVLNESYADRYEGPLNLVVGPYLWSDPTCPRSDGLTLLPTDFREGDGLHPSAAGRDKLVSFIDDYFTTHPSSQPWYAP